MLGWYTSCQTSYWVELEVHTTSSKFSLGASGIAHCGGCIADRFSRPLFSQASLRFAFRHPLFLSSATSVVSDHRRNTPRSDNHCNGVGKHSQISIYLHLSSLHLGPRISALGRLGLCSPAVKASKRQPLRIRGTLLTPRIVPPSQFSSPLQFLGLLLESVNPSPSHHHGRAQDTQGRLPTCLDESTPPPWIRLQLLSRPLQTKGRWCTHLSRCRPARTKCLRAQLVAAEPYLRPPPVAIKKPFTCWSFFVIMALALLIPNIKSGHCACDHSKTPTSPTSFPSHASRPSWPEPGDFHPKKPHWLNIRGQWRPTSSSSPSSAA